MIVATTLNLTCLCFVTQVTPYLDFSLINWVFFSLDKCQQNFAQCDVFSYRKLTFKEVLNAVLTLKHLFQFYNKKPQRSLFKELKIQGILILSFMLSNLTVFSWSQLGYCILWSKIHLTAFLPCALYKSRFVAQLI